MGLGAGGASRIGQGTGRTEAESVAVVRRALDMGVNIVDTAEVYGNEAIVGRAIREAGRRDIVVSTKKTSAKDGRPVTPEELVAGLEGSLSRLGLERVDIYHLHGVSPDHYLRARDELVPAMLKLKTQGKIGFLGITEAFESDRGHAMLSLAVMDDCWDVMMVGFNILNQSARNRVFPGALRNGCGVLAMFVVRKVMGRAELLRESVRRIREAGKLGPGLPEGDDLPAYLAGEGGAGSPTEAAYRFCRHEPGIHCVLSGTGNPDHVAANARALCLPPLPPAVAAALRQAFAAVDDVSGG